MRLKQKKKHGIEIFGCFISRFFVISEHKSILNFFSNFHLIQKLLYAKYIN